MDDAIRIDHGHDDELKLLQQLLLDLPCLSHQQIDEIFGNEGSSGLTRMLAGNH